ncbi:MAG TPA: DUF481 domain-containing protein [Cyclobacteriaceae bacterium]|nr:DUF481 domain-containing protein [Cyclobacteriaceae bacterium]
MRKVPLLLVLFLCAHMSKGQILKVDKGSLLLDSSKITIGNLGLNFNIHNRSATAEEEITFVGLTATSDVVYLSKKHAYISINNVHYNKATGGPLSSNGYSHLRTNFLRKQKFSYESFLQVQYDDGRNMPFRFLIGGGLRLRVLESAGTNVHLGLGAMQEMERWKSFVDNDPIIEKNILKTSDYIGITTKLSEQVNFHLIAYYQGGMDTQADVFRNRISGDFQLQVMITDRLSMTTSFSCQYEDKPIIPIKKTVYSVTNGLLWKF